MADTDVKIQPYVLLAKGARGRALADLIVKATAEPGLFGFSELLELPQVQEIAQGEHAPYFKLLQLFAYGTWPEYTAAPAGSLPALNPAQQNKLKQLTAMSLALQHKTLPYSVLQQSLGITSVRELEDYLINECFFTGALHGKLDQKRACLQVHGVVGRDVRPEMLGALQQGLQAWLHVAEGVLSEMEATITDAMNASAANTAHKAAQRAAVEDARRAAKIEAELRNTEMLLDDMGAGGAEEGHDMLDRAPGLHVGLGSIEHREKVERFSRVVARSKKRLQR